VIVNKRGIGFEPFPRAKTIVFMDFRWLGRGSLVHGADEGRDNFLGAPDDGKWSKRVSIEREGRILRRRENNVVNISMDGVVWIRVI
jgi:hypothetical protein